MWRTRRRRDAVTGRSYPWLFKESAMVNHWYFYGFDRDMGPFFIKFCGYFPFSAQIYLNGHEYAKQQCRRPGSGSPRRTTRSLRSTTPTRYSRSATA